jgi:hypothetical protein
MAGCRETQTHLDGPCLGMERREGRRREKVKKGGEERQGLGFLLGRDDKCQLLILVRLKRGEKEN